MSRRGLDATPRSSQWMTLGKASQFLGVDDSTLRAWADAGRIQAFRTPGGHRRFARGDLDAFLRQHRAGPQVRLADVLSRHGARLLQGRPGQSLRGEQWYLAIDRRTSEAMRHTCQRLMRALAGYLAGGRRQRGHRRDGERAGEALGIHMAVLQLTPSATTRAFSFFRERITHTVSTKIRVPLEQKMRSIGQIDTFLNHVLVRMMDAYERQRVRTWSLPLVESGRRARGAPRGVRAGGLRVTGSRRKGTSPATRFGTH